MADVMIDGAQGEGGGQVLRTSLTLAGVTGRSVEVMRIRAGRRKPGLLRQHLTAVGAVASVTDARVIGAELGSSRLVLEPRQPRAGEYRFAVGTAGSTTLVCQTVLPVLLSARGESLVVFEGGTHNPQAPPFDFLEYVYLPTLRLLGARVSATLVRPGFYPAGGGSFTIRVEGPTAWRPIALLERATEVCVMGYAYVSHLPQHVAEREVAVLSSELGIPRGRCKSLRVDALGPGNAVCILGQSSTPELVTSFGAVRVRAEDVARAAVEDWRRFDAQGVPVGEHLADQLVPLLVLCGGRFVTGPLSSHATTNIDVASSFGLGRFAIETEGGRTTVGFSTDSRL